MVCIMKKNILIICIMLACTLLSGCGNRNDSNNFRHRFNEKSKEEMAKEIADIFGTECYYTVDGDSLSLTYQYSKSESDIKEAISKCKESGFTQVKIEIHGKNAIGFYYYDNGEEDYKIRYKKHLYESYEEDFYRACGSWHPYLISQEAWDILYNKYHLVDMYFFNQYYFSTSGNFMHITAYKKDFYDKVVPRAYEIAKALMEADESIETVSFQVQFSNYDSAYFSREDLEQDSYNETTVGLTEDEYEEATDSIVEDMEPTGVDPADIHTYVECGEIVQYSDLTEDGDFGDVELETIVDDRYVTIYSDGTYYYMLDYMNDKITIALIEN